MSRSKVRREMVQNNLDDETHDLIERLMVLKDISGGGDEDLIKEAINTIMHLHSLDTELSGYREAIFVPRGKVQLRPGVEFSTYSIHGVWKDRELDPGMCMGYIRERQ